MVQFRGKSEPQEVGYKAIIVPDIHVPYHDIRTLRAVEEFMADYEWQEYVNLGDLLDFDMISKFNAEMLRRLESRRILSDYAIANGILDRHQEIVRANNPDAKFILLEGNHEYRMEILIDKAPQFEGMLEVTKSLKLDERGFKWVKSWSKGDLYKIGKLYFHHGLYVNRYHAAKMVDQFGVNIVYGHTHDTQTHAKSIRGKHKFIEAMSMGFLGDESKMDYMRNRPNNWCQAIGVAEFRPDGTFNLQQIKIINNQFTYNGKTYKG